MRKIVENIKRIIVNILVWFESRSIYELIIEINISKWLNIIKNNTTHKTRDINCLEKPRINPSNE